jgi:uncharacterized protein (TIGR02996 family)
MLPSKGPSRPEETGFLQEILTHPDDDAPRLVYADWLDDHGDEMRAEFIRLQIELAGMEEWDARRPELERRQKRLLAAHAREWGEGLGKKVYGPEFRRGFLEVAEFTPKVFHARAEELFRRFPLRCLRVGGGSFGDPALRLLAASPYLARLSRLELHSGQMTAAGVAALAASPHFRGLKDLEVYFSNMGPDGVRALAESPNVAGLTALSLRNVHAGTAGAVALARSPYLTRLEVLDLWGNDVGDEGAVAIARSPHLGAVKDLSLWVNSVGPKGARALTSSPHLRFTRLILSANRLGSEGVRVVAAAPSLGRVTHLGLGGLGVAVRGESAAALPRAAEALAGSPHLARLISLNLYSNRLGDSGALALAASPYLANLADLNLESNEITDAGSRALFDSPHLAGLQRITLWSNSLSPKQRALWRKRLGKNAVV